MTFKNIYIYFDYDDGWYWFLNPEDSDIHLLEVCLDIEFSFEKGRVEDGTYEESVSKVDINSICINDGKKFVKTKEQIIINIVKNKVYNNLGDIIEKLIN